MAINAETMKFVAETIRIAISDNDRKLTEMRMSIIHTLGKGSDLDYQTVNRLEQLQAGHRLVYKEVKASVSEKIKEGKSENLAYVEAAHEAIHKIEMILMLEGESDSTDMTDHALQRQVRDTLRAIHQYFRAMCTALES